MSLLLALDTSGATVTVALCEVDPGVSGTTTAASAVLAERTEEQRNRHAELLAPLIEQTLTEAGVRPRDLDLLGVGVGPGPFTGLRVGLVTAQVLGATLTAARGRPVPVYGVCSLDALAQQAIEAEASWAAEPVEAILVATDARRREVYWAAYRRADGRAVRTEGPAVDTPLALAALRAGRPVIGRGVQLHADVLGPAPSGAPLDVRASAIGLLAARAHVAGEPPDVRPLYLRRPDAAVPGERKRVLPA